MDINKRRILILGASSSIGLSFINSISRNSLVLLAHGNKNFDKISPDIDSLQYHFTMTNIEGFIEKLHGYQFDGIVSLLGQTDFCFASNMTNKKWDEIIFQNLTLPSQIILKLIGQLNNKASVILCSSALAEIGEIGMTHYATAKAGLIGFTKSLAKELSYQKIRVNTILPHLVESTNTEKISQKKKDAFIESTLLNRIGNPQDISNMIEFLLSDSSEFITGQILRINGGSYL